MKTIVIGIVLTLLLSSCVGGISSHYGFRKATTQERVVFVKEICKSYGYNDYTSEMTECVATEIRNRLAAAQRSSDAISESIGNIGKSRGNRVTCQSYGTIVNCRQY